MDGQSPGQNSDDAPDIQIKINIRDLLPVEHREIIDSQISSAHLSVLKEIEEKLIK